MDRQFWSTYQLSSSKYSFTDRYDSECYDHRLHSRCPAPHERVPTARGPRLQLRRGFPVCLSSHRCTFAKDPCMGSKLTRVTSRLLDARRARGGGVYSSSSEAAKKKRCRKGYAYRRWTKAQATNYGVTGVRHAGPFVDAPQDQRATVTALRETSSVGEPHPPAWESTCHWIGSVTCKQFENAPPPPVSELMRTLRPLPRTQQKTNLGLLASPGVLQAREVEALEPERQEDLVQSAQTSSSGSASPEQGPYYFGSTDSQCAIRPHGRASWWGLFSEYPGSFNPGQTADGVGKTQGNVFPECDAEHEPQNVTHIKPECFSRRAFAEGRLRSQIPGEIWGLWPSERARPITVSSDHDFRLFDGRERASSDGWCCASGSDVGASQPRRRSDGAGHTALLAGGCTSKHLRQPPTVINLESQIICTSCRPKMGDMCFSIFERDGGYQCEAQRDEQRPEDFFRWFVRCGKCAAQRKSKGKSCAKEERKGKGESTRFRGERGLAYDWRREHATGQNSYSEPGEQEGQESNHLTSKLDFCTWAFCLPRWILRCRTKFSWHLWMSFTATWHETASMSTIAFPLPGPHPGCFAGKGLKLNGKQRLKIARQRMLHVLVFTLDFLYLGRCPSLHELERRPNPLQKRIFQRLEALIAVCGNGTEQFDMVPGRSGPELGAALFQLEKFFELHPELNQSYVQHKPVKFKDDPGLFPSDAFPELAPYKSLDAKRLKLVGTGAWPMADFLSGPLWLPFQEPRFLLHGLDDDHSVWPALHAEDREENLELAKIWDARGLLRLHKFPLLKDHFSRVFNAFKNSSVDRQIGDRRIPNSRERSIDGPSHHLPPGFILVNMRVEPYEEQLFGSVTDRRDFYHQAKVSSERARSNMLPFSYSADELAGTRALAEVPFDNPRRKPRAVVGDGFGEEDCSGRLHEDAGKWFPCFGSLFRVATLGLNLR